MTARNFGVEIEAYNQFGFGPDRVSKILKKNKFDRWNVEDDASLEDAEGGFEIQTPILKYNKNSIEALRKVCRVLKQYSAYVNSSCGLHVHIASDKLSDKDKYNIVKRYARFEKTLDLFMTENRRTDDNSCAGSVMDIIGDAKESFYYGDEEEYWDSATSSFKRQKIKDKEELLHKSVVAGIENDKYLKVHGSSHGTLEFRHHHGTVDEDEIAMWVTFLHAFINASIVKYKGRDSLWRGIPKDVKKYYLKKKKFYDEIYPQPTARRTKRHPNRDR